MEKNKARKIQQEVALESYDLALEFLSYRQILDAVIFFDLVEEVLDNDLEEFVVDTHHDMVDTEKPVMMRVIWLSNSSQSFYFCLSAGGNIVDYDEDTPLRLVRYIRYIVKMINAYQSSQHC